MKLKISAILLALPLIIPAPPVAALRDEYGVLDKTKPAIYALPECVSTADLDCIQSVSLIENDKEVANAKFAGRELIQKRVDQNGNEIYAGGTTWQFEKFSALIKAELESPEHIIDGTVESPKLRGAALRVYVSVPDPVNTHLKIKFRTSWLRPMSVQLKTMNADFAIEKIPGGNLWTIGGSGLKYSDYEGNWLQDPSKKSFEAKADIERIFFDFFIHHADTRMDHGYWPPVCADKGFTVQSNNTNTTGEPSWAGDSLNFGVYAPHLTSEGSLNKGYFRLWTTDAFLNCKFPTNDITKSPNLKVEIIDENGKQEVATTTVMHSKGNLYVTAAGFHFSAPKIVISAVKSESVKATSVAPVKKTISCIKGKVVKKVTAANPVCPAGYKKK